MWLKRTESLPIFVARVPEYCTVYVRMVLDSISGRERELVAATPRLPKQLYILDLSIFTILNSFLGFGAEFRFKHSKYCIAYGNTIGLLRKHCGRLLYSTVATKWQMPQQSLHRIRHSLTISTAKHNSDLGNQFLLSTPSPLFIFRGSTYQPRRWWIELHTRRWRWGGQCL